MRVCVPIVGRRQQVTIVYPDLFPFFRPEFYAPPQLGLQKHQNPLAGNLCLLDRSTSAWLSTDTAAAVLIRQLPRLDAALGRPSNPPELEAQQAEPITAYYTGQVMSDSIVLMPPEAYRLPREQTGGTLRFASATKTVPPVRGTVTNVDGVEATLPPGLAQSFPRVGEVDVRWVRLDGPPPATAELLAGRLVETSVLVPPARLARGTSEMVAVALPEEVGYGGAMEVGWLFLVRTRTSAAFVATERVDAHEQALRLRDVSGLADLRVLLVGLGALGAPAGHLLLQARVPFLRVVDGDVLSVGNVVRWPLGFAGVGYAKVDAFASFAQQHYIETRVEPLNWRIGQSADPAAPDELRTAAAALEGIDAVVDASAEHGVQQFLSEMARQRGLPFVMVEAREGAYGGIVAAFAPEGPCWYCLKWHQDDGRFLPPLDDQGTLQPKGCASPTFTGAAFDLVPLAAMAVRVLAQRLTNPRYPRPAWNVAVLANRDDDDGSSEAAPRWHLAPLTFHQHCPYHGAAQKTPSAALIGGAA